MRDDRSLEGRTVLVTGAASGIGRQLARDLYWNERSRLILVDVDREGLETLHMELEPPEPARGVRSASRVESYVCDIASPSSVEALVRRVGARPIDVLVNNAGVAALGSFEKLPFAEFERVLEVNLVGTARVTKAFLPHLLKAERPFIVNVASMAGLIGAPGMSAYVTSKFGLVGFSEALSAELDGRVGVGTVCPTFVRTGIARGAAKAEAFLSTVGSSPAKASAAILRTVKQRKKLVLVNADAYAFYYLNRFFPGLSERLVSTGYRMLVAAGVVEP